LQDPAELPCRHDSEQEANVMCHNNNNNNNKNEADNVIEIDAQEQAMLNSLQLCQDAGTSLQFFGNLVTVLRCQGKKGFDIRKVSRRQTFLDNLQKKTSCPRPAFVQVGPQQVPTC
jgi:hypothetical protein